MPSETVISRNEIKLLTIDQANTFFPEFPRNAGTGGEIGASLRVAPGSLVQRATQVRRFNGIEVIAAPGEPLRSRPMPGDIVIHMIGGGVGHASVVAPSNVTGAKNLSTCAPWAHSEERGGRVRVVGDAPFAQSVSNGFAAGLTDSAGRLLEDLVLLRLVAPLGGPVTAPPAATETVPFPVEDLGGGSPFASKALDQCWSATQNLRRTLSASDNPSKLSRLRISAESRVTVDANPYSSIKRQQLDALIRASFDSNQMPHTILALWAKEGSLRMTTAAAAVSAATTADNARSLFRSNTYYVDLGSDHFIVTRYDSSTHDNVWDNTDDDAPKHESHFRARVAALVGPGLLSQDISTAINTELSVSDGPPYTVTPSIKFYSLSLLLMDALFTLMQRNSFSQVSSLSEPMNYIQWNIGTMRFREFLASAELHRKEAAYRLPSGDPVSLEQWALHTVPRTTEWLQPRVNAIRFMHYQESYRSIFALPMNLIKPGIEDLPSNRNQG